MIKPDLIIRSYRKSLCISISKDGELIVRAPKRLDIKYIFDFINQKEKWIIKKKKEMLEKNNKNLDVVNYEKFYYLGKLYKRQILNGVKEVELTNNSILFPPNIDKRQMLSLAQTFYINSTKEILKNRIEYFASLMKLNYTSVSIMNNKTRWGSCTKDGELNFNFRLSLLPPKVIDYIIIHELAHLIEFNHSKKFYKVVECIMPKYKNYRKELKDYDYLLQIYR